MFQSLLIFSYFLLNLALVILFSVSHGIIRPDCLTLNRRNLPPVKNHQPRLFPFLSTLGPCTTRARFGSDAEWRLLLIIK